MRVLFTGEPSFVNIGPSKGPLEGGTSLTIEITHLEDDYPVSVFIGNLSVSVSAEKNNR